MKVLFVFLRSRFDNFTAIQSVKRKEGEKVTLQKKKRKERKGEHSPLCHD